MSNVRYSYHIDPVRRGRVVTIARKLDGNDVVFGFAVCKPTYWVIPDEPKKDDTKCLMIKVEGDRFDKERGRLLSRGRMNKRPYRVTRQTDETQDDTAKLEHPVDTIRRYFEDGNVTMKDEDGEEIPCPEFILRTVSYNDWDTPIPTLLLEDGTEINMGELFTSLVNMTPEDDEEAENTGT